MRGSQDSLVIVVETSLVKIIVSVFFTLLVLAVLTLILAGVIEASLATYIAAPIWVATALLLFIWSRAMVRRNSILRRFSERLRSTGLSPLPGERFELYRAKIKGEFRSSGVVISAGGPARTVRRRYITTKYFEKIGDALPGYDLEELGVGNTLMIFPSDEGEIDGKALRIMEGEYRGLVIIPITPGRVNKTIEESVVDDDESCIYSMELRGCRVRGEIRPLVQGQARSYRVEIEVSGEAREKILGLSFASPSLRIYSGGPGFFETEIFVCRPIVLILHSKSIDMREIAEKVRKALKRGETIFAGYRENIYTLKLVIDRPLARDLVKKISI